MAAVKTALAVDCENTIFSLTPVFQDLHLELYDVRVSQEELDKNYKWVTPGPHGEDYKLMFSKLWDRPERVPLMHPKIPTIIDDLRQDHEICIRSAAPGNRENIIARLEEEKVTYDSIVFVSKAMDKLHPKIRKYIDDADDFAIEAADRGNDVILIPHGYNLYLKDESQSFAGSIRLADTWEQVPELVRSARRS